MNNILKKIIIGSTTILLVWTFLYPQKTEAVATLPHGGFNIVTMPCACSAFAVWYAWQLPLQPYLPITGGPIAIGIPPTALWYLYFDPIIPTTWTLGNMIPAAQTCWQPMPTGTGCFFMPVIGHSYMIGSGLPLPAAAVGGN